MDEKKIALEAIRKKLVGKALSYKEIYAIMDEIAHNKLGTVLTTYFVASGYSNGFSKEELFYLTRAMVETGDHLHFGGIVADKHSIGGVPGTRASLIVIPIIAAAGFKIPKSSSRAITTPAGTADCMEVLSKVEFTKHQIYEIVEKTNACLVWGGSFKIAPADDDIIRIEEPLLFESYDKILVSVMAKKIAFGSTHVVIDIPWGKTVKVHNAKDGELLGKKFEELAREFNINLKSYVHRAEEPEAAGIGPVLETRDALKVLEQTPDRPVELENHALNLCEILLDICLKDSSSDKQEEFKTKYKATREWAQDLLKSGIAQAKMMQIVKAQGGDFTVKSTDLKAGSEKEIIKAEISGTVHSVNNKNITVAAKLLGAPKLHTAGMELHKRIGDKVSKGDELLTLYSDSQNKLKEAKDTLELFPIHEIK